MCVAFCHLSFSMLLSSSSSPILPLSSSLFLLDGCFFSFLTCFLVSWKYMRGAARSYSKNWDGLLAGRAHFPVSTAPAIGLRSAVYLAHPSLCYWSLAWLAWYYRFSVCFILLLFFSSLLLVSSSLASVSDRSWPLLF